jgi:hypothetical protein
MAQTNQTACLQGTYNQNISAIDESDCVPCPDYTSTQSLGSESIAACKLDTDLDGIPDIIDSDDDNDGTIDELDAFDLDNAEDTDTDGDGVGDNADVFPQDETETLDTDGDGVGDNADAFPQDATETLDTDGDGVGDNIQQIAETLAAENAAEEEAAQKQMRTIIVVVVLLIGGIVVAVLFLRKRGGDEREEGKDFSVPEIRNHVQPNQQNHHEPILIQKPNPSPSVDQVGVIGGDGYEWINFPPNSQTNYYRAPGDKEWILWES